MTDDCCPTPSAPAETVPSCWHLQSGVCPQCHAEQVKRQADSLRQKSSSETRPIARKELIEGARNVRERAEERRSRVEPESCTACPCARCQAEREFMRKLAYDFGHNMPFAYTEDGDINVRVNYESDSARAARALLDIL